MRQINRAALVVLLAVAAPAFATDPQFGAIRIEASPNVRHAFVSAQAQSSNAAIVSKNEWNAAHTVPTALIASVPTGFVWPAQPAALTEFCGGSTDYRWRANLTNQTSIRLTAQVVTAGAATSALRLQYTLDTTGASGWDYLDSVSGPSVTISAAGVTTSATVSIATAAKAEVLLRLVGINGDGVGGQACYSGVKAATASLADSATTASTATALAADGANCPVGSASLGVDSAGVAQGCFPVPAGTGTVSGANTGDQTITLTGGVTGTGTGSFQATVITNADLTGPITSVGNATAIADAELAALAGLTSDADKLLYFSGAGSAAVADFSAANRAGLAALSGTNTGDQTTISGNAGTATALAADGANCPPGSAPLGVDASGAVQDCFAGGVNIGSAVSGGTANRELFQDGSSNVGQSSAFVIDGSGAGDAVWTRRKTSTTGPLPFESFTATSVADPTALFAYKTNTFTPLRTTDQQREIFGEKWILEQDATGDQSGASALGYFESRLHDTWGNASVIGLNGRVVAPNGPAGTNAIIVGVAGTGFSTNNNNIIIGTSGTATTHTAGPAAIGVGVYGNSSVNSGEGVGGYFTLGTGGQENSNLPFSGVVVPVLTGLHALVADNAGENANVFLGRDNGQPVFQIANEGLTSITPRSAGATLSLTGNSAVASGPTDVFKVNTGASTDMFAIDSQGSMNMQHWLNSQQARFLRANNVYGGSYYDAYTSVYDSTANMGGNTTLSFVAHGSGPGGYHLGSLVGGLFRSTLIYGSITASETDFTVGGSYRDETPEAANISAPSGSGTNIGGARLKLHPGRGTGTAVGGDLKVATSVPTTSGTTLQTLGDRAAYLSKYTALAEASATSFARVEVASGTVTGGDVIVTVEANDATDYQSRTLHYSWSASNKAGTLSFGLSTPAEGVGPSTGTLTCSITLVDAGSGNLDHKADCTSSLTQTVLRANAQVRKNFGVGAISAQ